MRRVLISCIALLLITVSACTKAPELTALETAAKYMEEGEYGKAIESYSALISEDSNNPEYYIGRAQAYAASGLDKSLWSAKSDYISALTLNDQDADAYLGLADVYVQMNDYASAEALLLNRIEVLQYSETDADHKEDLQKLNEQLAKISETAGFNSDAELIYAENLDISDIRYCYNPEITVTKNDIGVDMYVFHGYLYFKVNGPQEVSSIRGYICSASLQDRVEELKAEEVHDYTESDKELGAVFLTYSPPFYAGTSFAGYCRIADTQWDTNEVFIWAIDENMDYAGCVLIRVSVPELSQ